MTRRIRGRSDFAGFFLRGGVVFLLGFLGKKWVFAAGKFVVISVVRLERSRSVLWWLNVASFSSNYFFGLFRCGDFWSGFGKTMHPMG